MYASLRISQIFQSAENPQRKLSKFLLEYFDGAYLLHRKIFWEFPIIFAVEFPQIGKFGKFLVETRP